VAAPPGAGAIAPPVPAWLVRTDAFASIAVALLVLTQPGADHLLVLLALLGVYWLLGGILELVDLGIGSRRRAWRLLGAIAGIAAGMVVLREPLWSTLLVPALVAGSLGWFGLAAGGVRLLRAVLGGGPAAAVLGVESVLLGLVLLRAPPGVLVWAAAAVAIAAGTLAMVVATWRWPVRGGQRARARELTG